ncbi:Fc.00g047190.m01.CDS01 [Cosmosporella sp. VM-42]
MGNPSASPPGDASSAVSLRTTGSPAAPIEPYFDDDAPEIHVNDDPPPEYSDYDDFTGANLPHGSGSLPGIGIGPTNGLEPFSQDAKGKTMYYLDPRLNTDPTFLEQHINELSVEPPRPYVHIKGYHRETRKEKDKNVTDEVVDFDIQIDLTPLLYENIASQTAWQHLEAVTNFDKVRRGTVFTTRAPGFGGSGPAEDGTPNIYQWCRRYCESPAGLKTFSLERKVTGWDFAVVGSKLESLVRATNYRGHLKIDFPCQESKVEIWNDSWVNRWRLTRWIELTFYFTFLWLFTWPVLFFMTKRYETVFVEWPMSRVENGNLRYAAMSEDRWYNLWGRPIQRAVLARRQGTLAQVDLEVAYAPGAEDFARGLMAELTGKAPESPTDSLAGTTHSLILQTAYYTSTVPIWLDTITSPTEWSSSFLSPEAKEVLSVIGGVLLVFAIPQSTTGEKADETKGLIKEMGRVVKQGLGGWNWDGVGVAVGVGEGTTEGDEFWDEACGEEELEFVRVGGRQVEKNEFGEKTGIARVKEALETNNWTLIPADPFSESGSEFGEFKTTADREEDDDTELDPENLGFGFDRADFEGMRRAIWENVRVDDDEATRSEKKAGKEGEIRGGEAEEELDDEEVVKVERMMRKLQAVREAGEGMPEEQRKRMAAMAVQEVMKEL